MALRFAAERAEGEDGRDSPLVPGPIHGLRRWEVRWMPDGSLRLAGHGSTPWEPGGQPTRAICKLGASHRPHGSPSPRCSCGLYALHPHSTSETELGTAALPHHLPDEVTGIVAAWGRIELHEGGFRAELARPVALVMYGVDRDSDYGRFLAGLASAYGAELLLFTRPRDLLGYCRRQNLGLSASAVKDLLASAPAPASPASGAGMPPAQPPSPPGRLRRFGGAALSVTAVVAGIIWYGFWAVLALSFAYAFFTSLGDSDPGASATPHGLEVLEEGVAHTPGEAPVYYAVVRNRSEGRIATDVHAKGVVRDAEGERIATFNGQDKGDLTPDLAPGATGLVFDRLSRSSLDESVGGARAKVVASRAPARDAEVRMRMTPSFDHASCRLSAQVEAGERIERATIGVVGRLRGGEVVPGWVRMRSLAQGVTDDLPLAKANRSVCARLEDIDLYPMPGVGQGAEGRGRGARSRVA
jgi:hypothetical protein